MTYRDYINNTLSHENEIDWNYYGNHMPTDNILNGETSSDFIKQYFESGEKVLPLVLNAETADRFITEYFTAARKEFALAYHFDEQYQLPPERAVHTVSGFFLGLLIENCINGTMSLSLRSENYFPFSYLWFLTFLYHDYGYCVTERENCPVQYPQRAPIPRINDVRYTHSYPGEYRALAEIKRVLGISLSPFSQSGAFHFSSNPARRTEPSLVQQPPFAVSCISPSTAKIGDCISP